jgi:hypothetical protein
MMEWKDVANIQRTQYGVIVDVIEHRLCPNAPVRAFAEIEWYTNTRTLHKGRMQLVRLLEDEAWNLG